MGENYDVLMIKLGLVNLDSTVRLDSIKSFNLVVALIKAKDYEDAVIEFEGLQDNRLLDQITMIFLNVPEKLENLFMFTSSLLNSSLQAPVYMSVAKEIQKAPANHLNSILLLQYFFQKDICKDDPNCADLPENLKPLQMMTDIYCKYFQANVANEICNCNYLNIIRQFSPDAFGNSLSGKIFNSFIGKVIDSVLACENGLSVAFKFLQALNWNKHKVTGFLALKGKTMDMFQSLYYFQLISISRESLNGPDENLEESKEMLTNLLQSLPELVQAFVTNRPILIKNSANECLKPSTSSHVTGSHKLETGNCDSQESTWILHQYNKEDFTTYRIQNNQTLEFLVAHIPWKNKDDDTGEIAVMSDPFQEFSTSHYAWKLQAVQDKPGYKLLHIGRRGLLIAIKNDGVYLDLAETKDDESYWTFEAAP